MVPLPSLSQPVKAMLAFGTVVLTLVMPCRAAGVEPAEQIYTLSDVIALAIEHSPRLTGATGTIDERQGQRVLAGAYPNPTITGRGGRGTLLDGGTASPGAFIDPPPTSQTEYNAQVYQPLEWPGKRTARKQAAEAGLESAVAGYDEALLQLRADVTLAFWGVLLAQRQLESLRENLGTIESIRQIVDRRVDMGEAPRFESIKAEVEVLKAEQAVTEAQNTVDINRVYLNTLTAGSLNYPYAIEGELARYPIDTDLGRLIEDSLRQHPSLRRLRKIIDESGKTVEFQREARVPDVTVHAGYWREYGREAVQAGLRVPMPVWYQRQGEIAAAMGSMRRDEANLLRARYDLIQDVNQFFKEASTRARLVAVFEAGLLHQTQVALRMARFSFKQGESRLLQVLDAQRVHREVMLDYLRARYRLSVSITELERAVGGSVRAR